MPTAVGLKPAWTDFLLYPGTTPVVGPIWRVPKSRLFPVLALVSDPEGRAGAPCRAIASLEIDHSDTRHADSSYAELASAEDSMRALLTSKPCADSQLGSVSMGSVPFESLFTNTQQDMPPEHQTCLPNTGLIDLDAGLMASTQG